MKLKGHNEPSSNWKYGLLSGIGLKHCLTEGMYVCGTSKWE